MNKINLKCPLCNSTKLYKFCFDKQANQKYQCKECNRQFIVNYRVGRANSNYSNCPKCIRKTYLHNKYTLYNRYKYSNQQCNHILVQYHNFNLKFSPVTITNWSNKFTLFFKLKYASLKKES